MRLKTDGRTASADAMRQLTKAPRLEIAKIPKHADVDMLHTMNPLYLGSASSSANTCMEQIQQCSEAKFCVYFIVLLQILRSCRQASDLYKAHSFVR